MREGRLLEYIYQHNQRLQQQGGRLLIAPGDDMGMVRMPSLDALVACDQVVEGRHFTPGTPPAAVGAKAILRNLSDVAAMAAQPTVCVAAVAAPPSMSDQDARALFDGLWGAAHEWDCPLVGGDIAVHAEAGAPLVVTVTVMAAPGPSGRVVQRRGARPGDLLCVTGHLGGSLAADGGGRHLRPVPRIPQALALVHDLGADLHAMIDISDGLGRDAAHLAGDGLHALIDAARIPCTTGVDWLRALNDGEDYELLFACAPRSLPREIAGVPLTVIGRFAEGAPAKGGGHGSLASPGGGVVLVQDSDRTLDASSMGWEHREDTGGQP